MFGGPQFEKNNHKENLDRIYAKFTTNMGEFEVELYAKECPETVWNFVNLAEGRQETVKEGPYYNGLIFHRVIAGFVIQGGCPQGSGMGGPGYRFEDECHPELRHNEAGILSMANAGPGTNGSQFFITLGPTPHLDGRHTVFGKVTEGMNVINEIGTTATGAMDRPNYDVVMENVEIIRK
ncbi:MAG: peptidylprolyl isomerase [Bacteriovoracaceae bacterium]|jgi:cyclophilin family peptidyl-prolyl cis-trans isomerase|nr:peptidylprolyl isomerase [Bacteriovoracaceae bacterium]